jgi:hypothetical protein
VPVFQFHSESRIRQGIDNLPFHFDLVFFCHQGVAFVYEVGGTVSKSEVRGKHLLSFVESMMGVAGG